MEVDPPVGAQVALDARITLSVSTGSIDLPDVRSLPVGAARQALVDAGIDDADITEANAESDTVPAGSVVTTDPGPRSPVSPGDVITLLLAVPIPVEPAPSSPAPSSTPASAPAPSSGAPGSSTPASSTPASPTP